MPIVHNSEKHKHNVRTVKYNMQKADKMLIHRSEEKPKG